MPATQNSLATIDHIVHVMLENRSFDHMLGFLYEGRKGPAGQPFEGLTGTESNDDSAGKPVTVFLIDTSQPNAYYMPGADPGEGYTNTNEQIFGTAKQPDPATATMSGFVTNFATTITRDQKEKETVVTGTAETDIMGMFGPDALPVLSGLARGFAVCDHWYASVPTETLPNRAFACAATSQGHMSDSTKSFTAPSIFGSMTSHQLSWKIYGYDAEPLTRSDFPDTKDAPDTNFGRFTDFQSDAAAGSLPSYAFLEPSWGSTGNSEHPNYDVALGEAFLLAVYQAVRGGPGWNQTLLIITYDEHGGCYDHVPPPSGATPPDAAPGEDGFDFTRFGLRVPAVLVSPLIPAQTIFRVPEGSTPIDHTSVLKTVEQRFGLPALTARDAAAPDLGAVLTLTTPRTDDPMTGVTAPVAGAPNAAAGDVSHLQKVQAELAAGLPVPHSYMAGVPALSSLRTPADYARYIEARTQAWKRARAAGHASAG